MRKKRLNLGVRSLRQGIFPLVDPFFVVIVSKFLISFYGFRQFFVILYYCE